MENAYDKETINRFQDTFHNQSNSSFNSNFSRIFFLVCSYNCHIILYLWLDRSNGQVRLHCITMFYTQLIPKLVTFIIFLSLATFDKIQLC